MNLYPSIFGKRKSLIQSSIKNYRRMALLATIMTATTPTQALAIDYGSPDPNYQPSGGFVGDGADSYWYFR